MFILLPVKQVLKAIELFPGHVSGKYLDVKQCFKVKSVLLHKAPFSKVKNEILILGFCLNFRLEGVSRNS